MHPASSIILFTSLSGLGFGLMMWLGIGLDTSQNPFPLFHAALAIILAGIGLLASMFHLGNPQRAARALTQWRSSWLSREGIASIVTMGCFALFSFGNGTPVWLGWLSALSALATVVCTAMIYAQLRSIPRWKHPLTMPAFLLYALAGGALLAGQTMPAIVLLAILWLVQLVLWFDGDRQFARAGSTPETATGLGGWGRVRLLESPHSSANYLLKEMVFRIGRKHATKLRIMAFLCGGAVPFLLLLLALDNPGWASLFVPLAIAFHIGGLFLSRWLFFAQAEHVVGLYYGYRD
ncbi:MAG: dimethyl sulfoxide reductase anchor subunit [Geminicoccaceae bacterium]|nr:dimethyl sulfoxide reductase anchor subunit [Geminicoccaceae bacterium]MCB9944222.1 dimethyl sulfoxide reductase anchor subunit [Geminicoccaceae bacterium]